MRFVSISNRFFEICSKDHELLDNKNRRPYVFILKLRYKGKKYDFAVLFRSNIAENTPKEQYFPLPPRSTTRPGRHHGLHYLKMFPITKRYQEAFRVDKDSHYSKVQQFIEKHKKDVIEQCQQYQQYLDAYSAGEMPMYATNIDYISSVLFNSEDR